MTTIDLVKEFHEKFNIDNEQRRELSFTVMLEELYEFNEATTDEERLDALMDLQYFLDGTLLAYGWDKIKYKAFAEVHRSNMSKLDLNGRPIYRSDGKVLKGPNFTPPNLKQFLKEVN